MGGGDHLLFEGSPARLAFEKAIKNCRPTGSYSTDRQAPGAKSKRRVATSADFYCRRPRSYKNLLRAGPGWVEPCLPPRARSPRPD
ncbi:hypothetical protein EVAR_83532_1 [Eumeta japonica]|uniref:Uncharacterized protein n=1 Tax=Eumeta variegata TaxID=151549 RepID=A0A4C1ZG66_EUMVA|nr:hypothetical protein EVAR_83532_1 [Eumeta japonica]